MREQIEHRTGRLTLRLYQVTGAPCHWHDEMEFILPIDAPCSCYIDSQPITVEIGQALLIHGRQLHAITSERPFHVAVFHPTGICGHEMLSFFPPDRRFRALYNSEDRELMQALHTLFSTPPGYGQELLLKAHILYILGLLVSSGDYQQSNHTPSPFTDILTFIKDHACQRLTLQAVADHTHFSVSYISHAFRRYTGQSFPEFVNDCRLSHACDQLQNTDRSVLEIALSCGFDNVSYFIKCFKKRFGTTPHQFRT